MLEDVRIGLSFLVSCGELAGVPTPLARAFLSIGGAVCGEDFMQTGRTLRFARTCRPGTREAIQSDCSPRALAMKEPIACLGAGRMGRGIAVVFAYAGHQVALVDFKARDEAAFQKLVERRVERSPQYARHARRVSACSMRPRSKR